MNRDRTPKIRSVWPTSRIKTARQSGRECIFKPAAAFTANGMSVLLWTEIIGWETQ